MMSDTEHTPGPWTMNRGGGHARTSIRGSEAIHTNGRKRNKLGISSASYSEEVCQIHASLELPGPQANARLIAAAPALLAALVSVDQYFHDRMMTETSERFQRLRHKVTRTIADAV